MMAAQHALNRTAFQRIEPLDEEEYIAGLAPSKVAEARRVFDREFDPTTHRTKYNAFVKTELGKRPGDAYDKDARIIQAPDPQYKHQLGRYIKPIGKHLAELWSPASARDRREGCHVTYASGLTPVEVGRWFTDALTSGFGAFAWEVDFSRWDSTIGPEALFAELQFLEATFPEEADEFVDLIARTNDNVQGMFRGVGTYQLRGGRRSGDPQTSCGNSFLNGAVHQYYFDQRGLNARVIVLGDDMLALLDEASARCFIPSDYDATMRKFGLVPEPARNNNPCLASFCSQYFWPATVNGVPQHILGAKLGRQLTKLGFSYRDEVRGDYLANLISRFPAAGVLPIFRNEAARYIEHEKAAGIVPNYARFQVLGKDADDVQVTANESTTALCFELYGFTPVQLETYYETDRAACVAALVARE
jgi:hypothetical protein